MEGGAERFWTLSQLQGALAVVTRLAVNGTLGQSEADALTRTLFAVPLSVGEFRGALADWFQSTLASHLPQGSSWQERTVAAVAGGPTPGNPRVEWEGQAYRVDLAFAERRRIEEVQGLQGGPDLDLAFAIVKLARRAMQAASVDAVRGHRCGRAAVTGGIGTEPCATGRGRDGARSADPPGRARVADPLR